MNLQIENLFFSYHASPIIRNVSMEVHDGEFISFIGPSGCGKSTLFMLIGGLLQPQQGEIRIDGRRINGERGHIGYMPQQYSLFPWYTVEENVRLGQKLSRMADDHQVAELLVKANLGDVATAYPHELSGGMQQRVALIRTLASDKSFVCLDEPFGALDALTRSQLHRWIIDLRELRRRTILFITHSVEEAMLLSDRIYIFSHKPLMITGVQEISFPRQDRFGRRGSKEWMDVQQRIEQKLDGVSIKSV